MIWQQNTSLITLISIYIFFISNQKLCIFFFFFALFLYFKTLVFLYFMIKTKRQNWFTQIEQNDWIHAFANRERNNTRVRKKRKKKENAKRNAKINRTENWEDWVEGKSVFRPRWNTHCFLTHTHTITTFIDEFINTWTSVKKVHLQYQHTWKRAFLNFQNIQGIWECQ